MSKVRRLDFAEIRIPDVYFDTVKRKIVIVHKLKNLTCAYQIIFV